MDLPRRRERVRLGEDGHVPLARRIPRLRGRIGHEAPLRVVGEEGERRGGLRPVADDEPRVEHSVRGRLGRRRHLQPFRFAQRGRAAGRRKLQRRPRPFARQRRRRERRRAAHRRRPRERAALRAIGERRQRRLRRPVPRRRPLRRAAPHRQRPLRREQRLAPVRHGERAAARRHGRKARRGLFQENARAAVLGERVRARPAQRKAEDGAARVAVPHPLRVHEGAVARQRQRAAVRPHGRIVGTVPRVELDLPEVEPPERNVRGEDDVPGLRAREVRNAAVARHAVALPIAHGLPRGQMVIPAVRPVVAIRRRAARQAGPQDTNPGHARSIHVSNSLFAIVKRAYFILPPP